jgi:kynureninase
MAPGDPGSHGDLERWRSEFPILATTTYLISNSLGAMPRGAARDLAAYAEIWATRGVRAWEEGWWEMPRRVGDKVGRILGAPAGSISMHENVTAAQAVALSCLAPGGRQRRIVCPELDFPSVIHLYRAQEALGIELVLVPGEADLTISLEKMLDAIDETTLVVGLSHVLFRNSYVMDVAPVVERAHRFGATVILDVYQSAGILPLDVTALGVDFAAGGCLKWLCGGPGNGFLYTRPDLRKALRPRLTGWLAHRDPFAFGVGPLEPRDDAMRMMNGTPAIPAYHAALAGLDIVAEVGGEHIRAWSRRLTARLFERLDEEGLASRSPRDPERLAGTVALEVPEARLVARALKARDFLVDYRPGVGIRVSPHFYNTLGEVDRLVDETVRIVREKDYEAGAPFVSLVT